MPSAMRFLYGPNREPLETWIALTGIGRQHGEHPLKQAKVFADRIQQLGPKGIEPIYRKFRKVKEHQRTAAKRKEARLLAA